MASDQLVAAESTRSGPVLALHRILVLSLQMLFPLLTRWYSSVASVLLLSRISLRLLCQAFPWTLETRNQDDDSTVHGSSEQPRVRPVVWLVLSQH